MQVTGTNRRTISGERQWVEKHVVAASRQVVFVRFILLPPMWGALQVKEKPLPAA